MSLPLLLLLLPLLLLLTTLSLQLSEDGFFEPFLVGGGVVHSTPDERMCGSWGACCKLPC